MQRFSGAWLAITSHTGWQLMILLVLGFVTRFVFYGMPDSAIIDEINFGKYLSSYLTGEFYFDLHPPLARLLVAGFVALFDFQPIAWDTPWDIQFDSRDYLLLRLLPSVFGVLLPILFYVLVRQLLGRKDLALLAGLLIIFDNALLVQSRFLFFDVMLLCFGLLSLSLLCLFRAKQRLGWLFFCGMSAGAAMAVKWTALSFVLLPMLVLGWVWLMSWYDGRWTALARGFWPLLGQLGLIGAGAVLVYVVSFVIHFSLLPYPGPGSAFLSAQHQQELQANLKGVEPTLPRLAFWQKFKQQHHEMYSVNQRVSDHPFGSRWYQWPWGEKPVAYWLQGERRIDLQVNRVIWMLGALSVLVMLGCVLWNWQAWRDPVALLIIAGYLANWLPFMMIDRVMFLYAYLSALLFSLLALIWVLARFEFARRNGGWLMVPVLVGFALPITSTYGLPARLAEVMALPLFVW